MHRAAAHGAVYYVLVFAKGAFPADFPVKPNEVDEDELRAAVGKYFEVDDVRPAAVHGKMPDLPDLPPWPHPRDEKGRVLMPALLLTGHKAG